MVLSGVAVEGKIGLADPKVIYSLADAQALGIEEQGDNAAAYRHIREFYQGYRYISGSEVAELYIMLVANTMTLSEMGDITEPSGAMKLIDYAGGRVRLLGLGRTPDAEYEPVVTDGIDADCLTALQKAHDLANTYATSQMPLRVLIEARSYANASIGNLKDLHEFSYNRAGLVLMGTSSDGSSSIGLVLGIAAALPVQRSIARVKNGLLPITQAYIGDTAAELVTGVGTIHDKGYICVRQFPNRSGYFLTDDPMATASSDDYAFLARGRVIDKAHRIAYNTYVEEIGDDVEIDPSNGQLTEGYVAYLTQRITNNITLGMASEISGLSVHIDPNQNILATNKVVVTLKVIPVGYNKEIQVQLGFENPAG